MPTPLIQYKVKDLTELNDPIQLLGKSLEVESNSADQNFRVGVPLFIQTVAGNLPAPTKTTHLIARTFDANEPNYIPGEATLVSESLRCDLVMWMTAYVEFPYPSKQYRLVYDPNGQYQAYKSTAFSGQKLGAKWVELDQAAQAGIPDFVPFTTRYAQSAQVKFMLNGTYYVFSARRELVKADFLAATGTNAIPAPTGQATDPNWSLVNLEASPNHSRLGDILCRFRYLTESLADPYGGSALDQINEELLCTNRIARVELGPNAGVYRVAYEPNAPEFYAYVDGNFDGGKNPCRWKKVVYSDVDKAYVDANAALLQIQVTANTAAIDANVADIAANATASAANAAAISVEKSRMDALLNNAPQALDTLKEIADQIAADEQGTAAILATQQQHTQQLAGLVARANAAYVRYANGTSQGFNSLDDALAASANAISMQLNAGALAVTVNNRGSWPAFFDAAGTTITVNDGVTLTSNGAGITSLLFCNFYLDKGSAGTGVLNLAGTLAQVTAPGKASLLLNGQCYVTLNNDANVVVLANGYYRKITGAGKYYLYGTVQVDDFSQAANVVDFRPSSLTTDAVAEGANNKYYTNARAINSTLAGYKLGTVNRALSSTDTVTGAFNILEYRLGLKADLTAGKVPVSQLPRASSGIAGIVAAATGLYTDANGNLFANVPETATYAYGASNPLVLAKAGGLYAYNGVLTRAAVSSGSSVSPTNILTDGATFKRVAYSPFTPADIKAAVTGGTFVSGELQGTQPAGSLLDMVFASASYLYRYTYAGADTDGTQLAWVRLAKA